jgi:hypothetical protein
MCAPDGTPREVFISYDDEMLAKLYVAGSVGAGMVNRLTGSGGCPCCVRFAFLLAHLPTLSPGDH